MGPALDEGEIACDARGAGLSQNPIPRPAHVEKVEGQMDRHGNRAGGARRRGGQEPIKKGRKHSPVDDSETIAVARQDKKGMLRAICRQPMEIGTVVF